MTTFQVSLVTFCQPFTGSEPVITTWSPGAAW